MWGGGGVSVVQQTFILSPQLNPHQAANSGILKSGGELANRMKELTLFARSLLQEAASQILLQGPAGTDTSADKKARGGHSVSTLLFQCGLI